MLMPGHDIIAIGASAGGVEALTAVVRGLPADLPASVFVVRHIPSDSPSALPQILGRNTPLEVAHATDGEPIRHGRVYVAPPDRHLLVGRGEVRLAHGPAENRHRPAVDPTFRTAAAAYGPRVVGVVLTGALDDGSFGLLQIKRRGGIAVVQEPSDALYPSMPKSALAYVDVDYRATLAEMSGLLVELASRPAPDAEPDPTPDEQTVVGNAAEATMEIPEYEPTRGVPSVVACPDCHGVLWEVTEHGLLRFRCRVGHAYSAESMLAAHDDGTELALWAALRALEENAALSRRMSERARERGHDLSARRFEARGAEATGHADLVRNLLMRQQEAKAAELAAVVDDESEAR